MSILAELSNLRVYFYDSSDKRFIRAVENMSFPIENGKVLGLVGESGCGKTVTALSMMGLLVSEPGIINGKFLFEPKEEDGEYIRSLLQKVKSSDPDEEMGSGDRLNLFYGLKRFISIEENPFTIIKNTERWLRYHDTVMEKIRGKNISMIFQNPLTSLNPFLTIESQIRKTLLRYNESIDKHEITDMILELLRSVRLYNPEAVIKMYPSNLSMGMAQRVIIAIALASNPKLLIADEPTTGLDTTNKYRIIDLLNSIIENKGLSMLLISHNIRLVGEIADSIAVMYAGILVELGDKQEILKIKKSTRHPYTEALIQAIPTDYDLKKGKKLKVIAGRAPNNKMGIKGCPFVNRCFYATGEIKKKCISKTPPLVEVSKGHFIRCYLYFK